MEEPPKEFFISQGTPAYENLVYRLEKVDSREKNLVTSKLFSTKFTRKELL
jgi:hypothetical protein